MQALFSSEYALLWVFVLALALFYPMRQMIWTLSVRRAQRKADMDEEKSLALKKRANVTAGLLGFVFSYFYVTYLMQGPQ